MAKSLKPWWGSETC